MGARLREDHLREDHLREGVARCVRTASCLLQLEQMALRRLSEASCRSASVRVFRRLHSTAARLACTPRAPQVCTRKEDMEEIIASLGKVPPPPAATALAPRLSRQAPPSERPKRARRRAAEESLASSRAPPSERPKRVRRRAAEETSTEEDELLAELEGGGAA